MNELSRRSGSSKLDAVNDFLTVVLVEIELNLSAPKPLVLSAVHRGEFARSDGSRALHLYCCRVSRWCLDRASRGAYFNSQDVRREKGSPSTPSTRSENGVSQQRKLIL